MDFERDGAIEVSPLAVSNQTLRELDEQLLMFFTGYSRAADVVLGEQKIRSEAGDMQMVDNLHHVKERGFEVKKALENGDSIEFGRIMDRHWRYKRQRSATMSSPEIDRYYQLGMANGAIGGKLVGAGAGGFLLFYANDQSALRAALAAEGLAEVRFSFDLDGSAVLVRD